MIADYLYHISSISLSILILILLTISMAYGQSLKVQVNSNPTSIDVGEEFVLDIVLTNAGKDKQTITSLDLLFPSDWTILNEITKPFTVDSNHSKVQTLSIKVPPDLDAGVHHIVVGVNTDNAQYLGNTTVEVQTFQSFPLTGQLPVAVIWIIIPGIAAYLVISYLSKPTKEEKIHFDIGMMLLIGIPFGIISWLAMSKTIDEVPDSPTIYYPAAVGISAVLALVFSFVQMYFISLLNYFRKLQDNLKNRRLLQTLKAAQIRSGPKIWYTMLYDNIMNIRGNLGVGYGFRINVLYKDVTGNLNLLEALLWKFDIDPPYNIALRPKYTSSCKYNPQDNPQLVNVLSSSIEKTLKEGDHKYTYKRKLEKSFFDGKKRTVDDIVKEIKTQLLSVTMVEDLKKLFKKLDFSLHIQNIIGGMNLPLKQEYGKLIFLSADSVVSLELIRFEPTYQIDLFVSGLNVPTTLRVPESFELTDSSIKLK